MKFTFVLKDKGTHNQGWWLKVSNVDELCAYYEKIAPTRNGKVFENYLYGKEWNWAHHNVENKSHCPHYKEAVITDVIVRWGSEHNYDIIQSITGFQAMVASQQLESIMKNGCIYINRVGGYHSYYEGDKEYAFVHRNDLIFPQYTKNDIKVTKFPYGNHYYAHIGDLEVRDGNTIKWNTYDEAYRFAETMLEN